MSYDVISKFANDIKIEQTAKGARVTVHASGDNADEVKIRALNLYSDTLRSLSEAGHPVAPIEAGKESRREGTS